MVNHKNQPDYGKKSSESSDKAREDSGIQIDTTEYNTRLELLYEVANKATSYPEALKLVEDILAVTQRILNSAAVSLLIVDNDRGILSYYLDNGRLKSSFKAVKLSINSGVVRWIARTGMTVIVNDPAEDERFDEEVDGVNGITTESLLAVPLTRGQKVIGVLKVVNKAGGGEFTEQDSVVLSGLASTEALVLLVSMAILALRNIDLNKMKPGDSRRTDSSYLNISGHSRRVRDYALLAARYFSFPPEELQTIEFGALLHDLAKIGIRDHGLRTSDSLTDYERMILLEHAVIGADIISEIPFLEKAAKIVRYHHERYDGSGYPEGLKEDNIPMYTRLITVADAFDNMTTEYPHYDTLTDAEAIAELKRGVGIQFCPLMVEAFITEYTRQKGGEKREKPGTAAPEQPEKVRPAKGAGDSEEWRNRGINLLRAGRYEESIEAFETAIEINPNNAVAWRNKGTALGRQGKDVMALRAITRAIELDPGSAVSWHNKATALYRLGRNKEGKQAKDIEKQIRKKAAEAEKYRAKKETETAAHIIETEKQARKKAEEEERGRARLEAEEKARAEEEAEKLAKQKAEEEARERARIEAEEKAEKERVARHKAEEEAREKARLEAEEKAREEEADRLAKLRAEEEAKKRADREAEERARVGTGAVVGAVEVGDEESLESADAWRSRGSALVREGRHEEALKAFMKAIELDPKYTVPKRKKFVSVFRIGAGAEAIEDKRAEEEAEKLAKQKAEEEARERARLEAEEKARAEEEAEKLAKQKAEEEARERARLEAEEKARAEEEAEKLAKQKAEEEARERARLEAEEKARAEEEAEKLAKQKAEEEARERARLEAEEKARAEEEARERARLEAEEKARAREREKAEAKERAEREAREAAEVEEAERQAREREKAEAKERAEREAREAAEVKEAEKLAREREKAEAKERARQEAEEKAMAREAEKLAEKEAKERAKREAAEARERARQEAEAKAKAEEAERLAEKKRAEEDKEREKKRAEEAARLKEAEKIAQKKAAQEAKERAKKDAEEAARAREREKAEAKERARQEAEEKARAREAEKLAEKEAKERAKREAAEARERVRQEAEAKAKAEEAERLAEKKRSEEDKEREKKRAEEAARLKEAEKIAQKKAAQEAKERAKKEAEEAARLKEAEKIAQKKAAQEAKERAKKEAEEAARTREAEKLAKQEAKERARQEAEETDRIQRVEKDAQYMETELFEGEVRLEIKSNAGFEQVEQFKKSLKGVENLRIILDSWSEDEGIIIAVFLKEPMLFGNILTQMKMVDHVYRNKKKIVVVLISGK